MIDDIVQDIDLEKQLFAQFGLRQEVKKMIMRNAPVGGSARATVFINKEGKPHIYIQSQTRLQVADIKRIVSNMGLKIGVFIEPKGRPNYFEYEATKKFLEVFPGRKKVNAEDLVFYKTLVSYSPALAPIIETTGGTIKVYDDDACGKWRPGVKFQYRQITTK
ncbi:MAG: hypothetical protein LBH36_01940 [Candidatus Nomurabacteria bacterium]|jgi:hypothetical protein|nr:hypothetical protein [Candidatus Nomurabacteria bacterium]